MTLRLVSSPLIVLTMMAVWLFSSSSHSDERRADPMFATAFVVGPSFATIQRRCGPSVAGVVQASSSDTEPALPKVLSVSLEKPLGMVLEEVEEGQPRGVYVKELAEGGSAAASQWGDELVGLTIATVMGRSVTTLDFDAVMEELIAAPSPVELEFAVGGGDGSSSSRSSSSSDEVEFDVGTIVTIKVFEDNDKKVTLIEAKVGDNLRKTLFDNDVEVYRGFKAKVSNCGGAGQCTLCRADFVETEGWAPRSEYEDKKLKNAPDARLTCLNNIQGPATIRM